MSIEDKTVKENAWLVCKDFLGEPWKTIPLEEFKLFEVTGGLSNTMYRCALPANISTDPGVPKEVLLRIYGSVQSDANVAISEAAIVLLNSERKLGPKLYGLFPKGRLEEYIPSHSLSGDEMRLYSPIIARKLAKIHALDVPVKKVPEIFRVFMTKWMDEVQEVLLNDKENWFMSFDEFRKESKWIEKEMENAKSPVVYCHNDLRGGNILYREDSAQNEKPNLTFIDFEFASYNYRSFDLGNHFNEWCFDYDTDEYPHFRYDPKMYPTKKEQREFLMNYLDQLKKEGVEPKMPMEDEINKMLSEIPLFVCAINLMAVLWCAKIEQMNDAQQSKLPTAGFAHKEHGNTRKKVFQKFKEQYLATTSNGAKADS